MLTWVERQSSGTIRDSGEGGAIGSKTSGSYVGIELEIIHLKRQPISKNPPQVQDREREKISKNWRLWGRGHRKLLKTYERRMFPELNMARDTKAMSDGVIATKTLLWYTIAKKAIDTSTRLELCSFMRRKRDKTSTTKNSKRWIVNGLTIKELKGWFVMYGRWRNTINGVNSSECCLTPKVLRNKGKNEKGADNIKNVIVFSFCMTILLRDVRKRPVRESTLVI